MIGFIKGVIDRCTEDRVILENGGIGYEVFMPGAELEHVPHVGEEVKLYTYLHVREDAMQLYGFLTSDACDFFKLLISVSGVGPKGALAVLSTLDVDSLRFAILAGDAKAISRAPGIGKKMAEKIILELRDKCDADDFLSSDSAPGAPSLQAAGTGASNDAAKDAVEALVALGYGSSDAMRAVRSVTALDGSLDVEAILKQALKVI